MDLQSIWEQTLSVLKKETPIVSFNTFILTLIPVKCQNQILYLKTDNSFNKSVLNQRYKTLIANALRSISDQINEAVFIESENDIPGDRISEDHYDTEPVSTHIPSASSNLNSKYTFDNFVIGENNRFAHAACVAVAEIPSDRYNPLFIYGGVGLGKTHLMQAVGNYIEEYIPNNRVLYVTCEEFTNEFIDSIRNQNSESFRNKYRNIDTLLIDDIQFLANKEGTQEEFFHTFNALHADNKQIVISSDRQPGSIPNLTDRLRSRFESGLITDISAPNFETRIAILRKKAESYEEFIPDDVLSYLADHIHSNIRELEGALTSVVAMTRLMNKPISLSNAQEVIQKRLEEKSHIVINADYIKEVTAKYFNVTVEQIDSKKRTKAISTPRQVAMFLTREMTDLSLPRIGEAFGGRDHSTIMHGCQKISEEMDKNIDFKNLVMRIRSDIQGKE